MMSNKEDKLVSDKETDLQEEKKEENLTKKEKKELESLKKQVDELLSELHKTQEEANKWKNDYYMVYADLANTRKQIEKDNENYRNYLSMSIVDNFLSAFDALELSTHHNPEDEKVKKFISGNNMIFKMIMKSLEDLGFSSYLPAPGDEFNPTKMNAIDSVPGEKDNLVSSATCRGYFYKDRILRPANVVVTKKEENQTQENKDESK